MSNIFGYSLWGFFFRGGGGGGGLFRVSQQYKFVNPNFDAKQQAAENEWKHFDRKSNSSVFTLESSNLSLCN